MKSRVTALILLLLICVEFSLSYKTWSIEDPNLCSQIGTRKKIKLYKGERSALRVNQKRLNNHRYDWTVNFECKFQLQTAYGKGGVIAIIQNLNLRRREDGTCLDYIEFSSGNDKVGGDKKCGYINAVHVMQEERENPIAYENSFIAPEGHLNVNIFIEKSAPDGDIGMDIDVIFTAYKSECDDDMDSCVDNRFCIHKMFFHDKVVNCPLFGCVDEGGCENLFEHDHPPGPPPPPPPQSIGTKVLIGSVSSLFIFFVLFILCIWACKKHKVFCWADEFANPSTTTPHDSSRNSRVMEMNQQTGARLAGEAQNNVGAPTAPPDEDKDLPPSYDSLFPESTTTNR